MLRRSVIAFLDARLMFRDIVSSGKHDPAPREDEDFKYLGSIINNSSTSIDRKQTGGGSGEESGGDGGELKGIHYIEHQRPLPHTQVVPGSHPLPLHRVRDSGMYPHISPYIPSPHRPHPYFTSPIPELPHFRCGSRFEFDKCDGSGGKNNLSAGLRAAPSTPIVYLQQLMKVPIIAPVFSIGGNGEADEAPTVTHTRELDPFIFGMYPNVNLMSLNSTYWVVRCRNYVSMFDYHRKEIWKRRKKPWPNTGTGRYRTRDLTDQRHSDGARSAPTKPWNMKMPRISASEWSRSNRMALCLKLLQGRVQIVDRLTLAEPTVDSFVRLCARMRWDVRHTGAGVLFIDGGSRVAPSQHFDRNFFYGAFYNGRVKLVRPTVQLPITSDAVTSEVAAREMYDWNSTGAKQSSYCGPRGPKNPVPFNRFNCFDALEHDRVVITEGALLQLEKECFAEKMALTPPHIRNLMAVSGMLNHYQLLSDVDLTNSKSDPVSEGYLPSLGTLPPPLTIEEEAAARMEEAEAVTMYNYRAEGASNGDKGDNVINKQSYYDNPYRPWADEADAVYSIDAVEGKIVRNVIVTDNITNNNDGIINNSKRLKKGSWAMLE